MGLLLCLQLLLAAIVPAIAEIEMKFIKYPESVTAPEGDTVTFECAVNVPGERLVWRWKPVDRPEDDWKDIKETKNTESTEVSAKLVVEIKKDMHVALYQCVVWYGSVSLVSVPARLTIAKMDLSKNTPETRVITAPLHNTVVLHCKEPLSEPLAVLTWWKDDGKKTKKILETPHGVLVIHNATLADSGTYGCRATNEISGQAVDLPEKIHLKIQQEGSGGVRFLETEEYVGKKDSEGTLTLSVKPGGTLRMWCGAVSTPPPRVTWSREGKPGLPRRHDHMLVVSSFTQDDEGVYSCSANGIRRSWKVLSLQPPQWESSSGNANASEGDEAHVSCGTSTGQPPPTVHWVLNAALVKPGKGIKANNSDLTIERAEKRHAGIVQCFACNPLGCVYDAAMLTVVPLQISDQEYSIEVPKTLQFSSQPKRHNRKNPRKHKAVMIPPSRPNVTRLSDEKVMVTWSNANHGLPILFFKVQYREVTNTSNVQWNTANQDIPAHIHAYEIDGLIPDKYYKFRIAAVYSNQDNNQGRSSAKFYLQSAKSGNITIPLAPVLVQAVANSPNSIQLDWTWSKGAGIEAEGFYLYYRAVSSAGAYEKVMVPGEAAARTMLLSHLAADTPYELKLVAFTTQSPSDFSAIKVAKTLPSASAPAGGTNGPAAGAGGKGAGEGGGVGAGAGASGGAGGAGGAAGAPDALVTAGGAVGAAALLLILAVTLLLCRRAKRPTPDKEKGPGPESGGANGYIPAKVPITITANPMHSEGADAGVEMSFLHNNNTGNNDDTLPHSRKNGPARQYV